MKYRVLASGRNLVNYTAEGSISAVSRGAVEVPVPAFDRGRRGIRAVDAWDLHISKLYKVVRAPLAVILNTVPALKAAPFCVVPEIAIGPQRHAALGRIRCSGSVIEVVNYGECARRCDLEYGAAEVARVTAAGGRAVQVPSRPCAEGPCTPG